MKLQDFLEELKDALDGEIPPTQIEVNLKYYRDYVKQREQQGKTEEEILNELGEPRLIARTIIDTSHLNKNTEKKYNTTYQKKDSYTDTENPDLSSNVYHMPLWLFKVIAIIVILLIISILFWIGGMAVKLILKIGIPLLIIYLLYSVIKEFFPKK